MGFGCNPVAMPCTNGFAFPPEAREIELVGHNGVDLLRFAFPPEAREIE
jgi:hypothetical protein